MITKFTVFQEFGARLISGRLFRLVVSRGKGVDPAQNCIFQGGAGLLLKVLFFNDFYFDLSDEFHQSEWRGLFFL